MTSLLARGRTLIEVDTRLQVARAGAGLRALVGDIADAVEGASVRTGGAATRPALVGYSIGAQAAAAYAAEYPGAVSSVALVAGWMRAHEKMREVGELWRLLAPAGAEPGSGSLEAPVRAAQLVLASAREWPGAIEQDRVNSAASEIDGLLALLHDADLEGVAERIADPVLVLGCSLDEFATVQQSRLLFGAIPEARLAEIDCGHLACVERPAEVVAHIESFIGAPSRHPAGARIDRFRP